MNAVVVLDLPDFCAINRNARLEPFSELSMSQILLTSLSELLVSAPGTSYDRDLERLLALVSHFPLS